jgi:hypothetical protein
LLSIAYLQVALVYHNSKGQKGYIMLDESCNAPAVLTQLFQY